MEGIKKLKIIVTGGLGYIGSHVSLLLLNDDHEVVILESYANCFDRVEKELRQLAKKGKLTVVNSDLNNAEQIDKLFSEHKDSDLVIHFAALKSVPESIEKPDLYYQNNIVGTMNLLNSMIKYNVNKIIFSSSATVYGNNSADRFTEDMTIGVGITNPYGRTKVIIEQILEDYSKVYNLKVVALRYFNPMGSLMHCLQRRKPTDLMTALTNPTKEFKIFGDNFPTKDGTCMRDYVHILDLADGHITVIKAFDRDEKFQFYNLGTGRGTSVREVIALFEQARGVKLKVEVVGPRDGDIVSAVADVSKIKKVLGWEAKYTVLEALALVPSSELTE